MRLARQAAFGSSALLIGTMRTSPTTVLAHYFACRRDDKHEFRKGSVFHMPDADVNQEVFGLPEYLSSPRAAWLNVSATRLATRRKSPGLLKGPQREVRHLAPSPDRFA